MPIIIREAKTLFSIKQFIHFPANLHKNYIPFVPPIYRDEWNFHKPNKNKNLLQSERILLLAIKDNEICGRVMGIIYHPWNDKMRVRLARFYQLDCNNDNEVAKGLLNYVENWARDKGMDELIGSFGFSDKDPQGIQVEGFEYPPVIASVSHQPYLGSLVEGCGYEKFKDCVSYKVNIPDVIPEVYKRIYQRTLHNQKLKLVSFKNRRALKPYFVPVLRLMNEGYENIYGFVPMTEEDIRNMAQQYLSLLNPQLVKIVVNEKDEPVAFVIAMANISEGIKKAKGKLFPVGFIHILIEMKRSQQLDLLLGAVATNYRGRGLNVLMGISLMEAAKKLNMKIMDSHLILEENRLMRAEMEKLGGVVYKRYRIYRKKLVTS